MVKVLSDSDIEALLDLDALLPVVERAFVKQGRGEVERPERPHFPVGTGLGSDEPLGTMLTMPAYIHGAQYVATKLASVHDRNVDRGLPTVNATIALSDAATGLPRAYMAGTRITNARTGCIGGLAARELATADGAVTLGIVGSGTQARWQARAIATAVDVDRVQVYSRSDSRAACAADLREAGMDATAVDSAEAAVSGASVVVTASTSTEPVFDGRALDPGTLVVAIGAYTPSMRELDATTVDRAARVFADVPEEAATTGDLVGVDTADLIPLSAVFERQAGRKRRGEILVVVSVGSAVLDAATAEHLVDRAKSTAVGTTVSL